jgi:hypothetical protein
MGKTTRTVALTSDSTTPACGGARIPTPYFDRNPNPNPSPNPSPNPNPNPNPSPNPNPNPDPNPNPNLNPNSTTDCAPCTHTEVPSPAVRP